MNFKPEDVLVTEARAVVAYCDVTGFTGWMNRAAVARSDVQSFIRRMKFVFRQFRIETGFDTIPTGDGIIALLSTDENGKQLDVLGLIVACFWLRKRMMALIKETPYPRPVGFRIRIAGGFVYKVEEPPMPGVGMTRSFDFLGACLNLGARLLEYRRDIPAMITEEALDMMPSKDKKKLFLRKIEQKLDEKAPRGVDPEEFLALKEFELRPIGVKHGNH